MDPFNFFCCVQKSCLHIVQGTLPDSQLVAVKRLGKKSEQGITELMSEVVSLAKLQHRNLVRIVGVCVEESEELIVFESGQAHLR